MSSTSSLQFGVEIELLIGSRKKSHSSWKSLAKELSKRLSKAGIANHVNEGNDKSPEQYREWSIVQEVTIPSQPGKGLWGLELVSPVYPAAWYWATDLETIFSTLRGSFALAPSQHCSTHVHVSGSPFPLSAFDLAALAKAALYYEPALDALVPAGRRASAAYWCQSNRSNPALAHYPSLADCLTGIDAAVAYATGRAGADSPSSASSSSSGYYPPAGSSSSAAATSSSATAVAEDAAAVRAVVEAMNLFPASSPYGRAHGKKHDFVRGKVYKWDFTGMLAPPEGGGRGTVEFRQAPGSASAEEAKGWVTLALALVAGVVADAAGGDVLAAAEGGAALEELWGVLGRGADALGWEGLGAAEGIFARREA
ncbi:hypothetical protein NKR23_g3495 [Pleurostoma richardsiae]|uniref:Amidoligase enzyme-domain-containing protein n=1 Tax=Pleurostoma richardsiae TaxID=41990 RepID=A0AA38RJ99_9PEZI|nr:hypothetical protein NKR23_g3495 [Pleurostoma richardsiae]